MALTLLAERRKPSGECLINTAKPEGSRPAATRTQSKVSAIGLAPTGSQNRELKSHPSFALSGFRDPIAEHRGRSIRIFTYQGGQIVFDVATGSSKSRRRKLTVRLVAKRFIFFLRQRT